MRKRPLRLGTAAAGVLVGVAFGPAVTLPAYAHDVPAPEFNGVLHGPHHDKVASDETWPDCDTVAESLGDDADSLIKDGYDTWVFYVPEGEFDVSGAIAHLRFDDTAGEPWSVPVPGDGSHGRWLAGDRARLAVAVPAGWTLTDGDFAVVNSPHRVEVKRTCPDRSAGNPGPSPATPDGRTTGDDTIENDGENSRRHEQPDDQAAGDDATVDDDQAEERERSGLAVTGAQVGGMLILGVGLLAAGIAMSAVKRRRDLSRLLDE
jgi:hypothetical protein